LLNTFIGALGLLCDSLGFFKCVSNVSGIPSGYLMVFLGFLEIVGRSFQEILTPIFMRRDFFNKSNLS